jgi:hypothetical protein
VKLSRVLREEKLIQSSRFARLPAECSSRFAQAVYIAEIIRVGLKQREERGRAPRRRGEERRFAVQPSRLPEQARRLHDNLFLDGCLPRFAADRFSAIPFFDLAVLGDSCDERFQTWFPANASYGRDDDHAVAGGHVDIIAHGDARVLQDLLGEANPLAAAPFLNFGNHINHRL